MQAVQVQLQLLNSREYFTVRKKMLARSDVYLQNLLMKISNFLILSLVLLFDFLRITAACLSLLLCVNSLYKPFLQ